MGTERTRKALMAKTALHCMDFLYLFSGIVVCVVVKARI